MGIPWERPMGWDRHKLLWEGNGTDKYVPWTTLSLSMGMSFLWESNGKRPMGWDRHKLLWDGMGMGQINMSHGQPLVSGLTGIKLKSYFQGKLFIFKATAIFRANCYFQGTFFPPRPPVKCLPVRLWEYVTICGSEGLIEIL